ncbi:diphosphomevalonate decarboxylase [Oceanivirga salmonicida]|uniref:diphosphomevalonate decarboxylase n=1 Tax=Oceanivirga salmonicida TaxID=1769291 RepID=UPI00083740B6|nr:diphosphomevalonate decarboxylase [Oceanivirga salmonicida]
MNIAYMNIAIIKYWCKNMFNPYLVPLVPSISLLSTTMYTKTKISASVSDTFYLNGKLQDDIETSKIFSFVDKVVSNRTKLCIESFNSMPTAAGLASSASAYSALTMELNKYFDLGLTVDQMCKIASMGSGSAARSFFYISAFDENGEIYPLKTNLEFGMKAIIISDKKKSISSRAAMEISKNTSNIIDIWVEKNKKYFVEMKKALLNNDFELVGKLMQESTKLMHEVMKTSTPSINYLTDKSVDCIKYIENLQSIGYKIYWTTDAGPNVKVLYLKKDEEKISKILNEKYKGVILNVI